MRHCNNDLSVDKPNEGIKICVLCYFTISLLQFSVLLFYLRILQQMLTIFYISLNNHENPCFPVNMLQSEFIVGPVINSFGLLITNVKQNF